MTVQSIAFPKNWKRSHITSWLRNHNYHPIKEDSTVNFIRFRILPPHRNAIICNKNITQRYSSYHDERLLTNNGFFIINEYLP